MIVRRGPDPGPFKQHTQYKLHLQPVFRKRCAYCLTPDHRLGGLDHMTVDHFYPVTRFPQLGVAWTNLYYSCVVCNSHYKKDHPTAEEEKRGCRFVDPCKEDPDDHFRMARDANSGRLCCVQALSDAGRYTVTVLKLNARKSLRESWQELDQLEQTAVENLTAARRHTSNIRALIRSQGDLPKLLECLEDAKSMCGRILDELDGIRSQRPFPAA